MGDSGHARRRDPWSRVQAFEQVLVELHRARAVVAVERRRQLEGDQVVERHTRVRRLQVLKAADEEAGAEEQQEAQRHLRGHQSLAQKQRPAGARNRPHRVLQRRPRIRPARAQRRQQPEDDARQAGQAERERQDPDVGLGPNQERLSACRDEREQPLREGVGEAQTDDAADAREDEALDEQLRDQAAA